MTEELERETEAERWGKEFGIEERLMSLREKEATTPSVIGAGEEVTGEGDTRKVEADIESYAQSVLRGEKSLTSVSDKIEPQVRARVEELKRTQRVYTDEQIRAQIRNWLLGIKADYGERSDQEITEALKGTIELSELTDPDRERFQLILSEIVPTGEKKKGGFVEWFKEPFRTVKSDIASWFK